MPMSLDLNEPRTLGRTNVIILIGVALVVIVALLGYRATLGEHEVYAAEPAREMLAGENWLLQPFAGAFRTKKPPGQSWLIAASMFATRVQNEYTARLPSALAATGLALLLASIGARLAGRRVGLVAGLMTLTCYGVQVRARLAEADMALALCVALSHAGVLMPLLRGRGELDADDRRSVPLLAPIRLGGEVARRRVGRVFGRLDEELVRDPRAADDDEPSRDRRDGHSPRVEPWPPRNEPGERAVEPERRRQQHWRDDRQCVVQPLERDQRQHRRANQSPEHEQQHGRVAPQPVAPRGDVVGEQGDDRERHPGQRRQRQVAEVGDGRIAPRLAGRVDEVALGAVDQLVLPLVEGGRVGHERADRPAAARFGRRLPRLPAAVGAA
ncbi:MAG: hypothetical protein EOP68_13995, partial [Sphingomonas sp.]